MPPSDAEDSSSSCSLPSFDADGCSDVEKLSKEDEENDEAGSQVTLSTKGTYDSIDFLMPGGLSTYSAVLLAKPEKKASRTFSQVCQPFNCDQEELPGVSEDADPGNCVVEDDSNF
jgi:hypothetical protein